MFLFSRNRAAAEKKNAAPAKVKKEVKKDIQINEYLSKIKKHMRFLRVHEKNKGKCLCF